MTVAGFRRERMMNPTKLSSSMSEKEATISRRVGALIVVCAFLVPATPACAQEVQSQQSSRESPAVNEGILRLRAYQMKSRKKLGIVPKLDEKQVVELALKQAKRREELSTREGELIRTGINKYPAQIEQLRWNRTRAIIQRVIPGLDEDPIYLELLARQAASIEMVLLREHTDQPNAKAANSLDRVLLGTVPNTNPDVFSQPVGDYSFVVLSDGFITFLYQAAKSAVLSWRPQKALAGSTYSLSPSPEDIEYVLKRNPYPQELLYKTLYAWLFNGYPRAIGYSPPPDEYAFALDWLITLSERYTIAHEYAHALLDKLDLPPSFPANLSPAWGYEYRADYFAFVVTSNSGGEIDQLPPNMALQGAFFTLTALDIKRKAVDIVRCGRVREDKGSVSHPPLQDRIKLLRELYAEKVGVGIKYDVPIKGQLNKKKTIDLDIEGALAASDTLNLLWSRIEGRFYEAHRKGMKLDDIWGEASCS